MAENIEAKNHNILLTILGKGVSRLGSQLYGFAMSFHILFLTGSSQNFALSLLLTTIPSIIISPIAGHFADFKSKKALVVGSDIISSLVMFFFFWWTSFYGLSLWVIYITTFLLAVFSTVLSTTLSSSLPSLVKGNDLLTLNSALQGVEAVVMFLGPILGGFLYKIVSPELFLLLNGVSFILSAISEMFIDFHYNTEQETIETEEAKSEQFEQQKSDLVIQTNSADKKCQVAKSEDIIVESVLNEEKKGDFKSNFKEGFTYLKSHTYLFSLMIYVAVMNFFDSSFLVVMPYVVVTVRKMDSVILGAIQMMFPVGMILGSILVKKLHIKFSTKLLQFNLLATGLVFFLFLFPILPFIHVSNEFMILYYIITLIFLATNLMIINIPASVYFQKTVEREYLGRVTGIFRASAQAMIPLAYIIVGVLLDYVPTYYILFVCGVFNVLIYLHVGWNKNMTTKI